jgi:hypothetical protein
MRLTLKMLALSMLLLGVLTGCSRVVTIYPITDKDFTVLEKGKPSPIDGYGMSEFYFNEVLQVKLSKK